MTTPSNDDDLDAATRRLIQTLLTIQYHQDLALVRDTPYRTRTRKRDLQIRLRQRYQALGLHNTTIPHELETPPRNSRKNSPSPLRTASLPQQNQKT